jgi:putative transposase
LKSKKKKNSLTIPQFAQLEEGKFFAPKFKEEIKVNVHREVKGKMGQCTISKTSTGKHFVSILSEEPYLPKEKSDVVVGVDLGLKLSILIIIGIEFKL